MLFILDSDGKELKGLLAGDREKRQIAVYLYKGILLAMKSHGLLTDRHIMGDSQNNCGIKKDSAIKRYILHNGTYMKFKNKPNKSV